MRSCVPVIGGGGGGTNVAEAEAEVKAAPRPAPRLAIGCGRRTEGGGLLSTQDAKLTHVTAEGCRRSVWATTPVKGSQTCAPPPQQTSTLQTMLILNEKRSVKNALVGKS